jgi:hypothetical protein
VTRSDLGQWGGESGRELVDFSRRLADDLERRFGPGKAWATVYAVARAGTREAGLEYFARVVVAGLPEPLETRAGTLNRLDTLARGLVAAASSALQAADGVGGPETPPRTADASGAV